MRKILAIESTCDETATALVVGDKQGVEVVSSVVASSASLQAKYGGVVPEVAAREQVRSIVPVLVEVMKSQDLNNIDGIAVSYGPGLVGSLLVGVETAKILSWAWNKPLFKVNHMFAHIAANWIRTSENFSTPLLPALALTISGGHTDFHLVSERYDQKWIGGTVDDAAGEAFDKVARILDLPYPGGPSISRLVDDYGEGKVNRILPRPMINDSSLKLSFSGLKAAVLRTIKSEIKYNKSEVAVDFNKSVAEVLCKKTKLAIETHRPRSLLVAGGVAANIVIRNNLNALSQEMGIPVHLPELKYCGDNAAMVGAAAILKPEKVDLIHLLPVPNLD